MKLNLDLSERKQSQNKKEICIFGIIKILRRILKNFQVETQENWETIQGLKQTFVI